MIQTPHPTATGSRPGPGNEQAQTPLSLLRMSVGGETLAVPIDDVREILQVSRLTPLPRTPHFVRGVMNLRGAVVPVIDLAARLGGSPAVTGRRSCIVVVDCSDATDGTDEADDEAAGGRPVTMGLLVDAVYEVFDRAAHEVEAAPSLGTRISPGFLRGMTRADGQLIGVLALQQVLSAAELAEAIAAWRAH